MWDDGSRIDREVIIRSISDRGVDGMLIIRSIRDREVGERGDTDGRRPGDRTNGRFRSRGWL